MNLTKIIKEEITNFAEGITGIGAVADRLAARRFNLENPMVAMEKKIDAASEDIKNGEFVGEARLYRNTTPIYLNPLSLSNFDADVRAFGNIDGDLYVAQLNIGVMHSDMANGINKFGKRTVPKGPEIYYTDNGYLLMYRKGKSNIFTMSISSKNFIKNYPDEVNAIILKVKEKNPQFIINKEMWGGD